MAAKKNGIACPKRARHNLKCADPPPWGQHAQGVAPFSHVFILSETLLTPRPFPAETCWKVRPSVIILFRSCPSAPKFLLCWPRIQCPPRSLTAGQGWACSRGANGRTGPAYLGRPDVPRCCSAGSLGCYRAARVWREGLAQRRPGGSRDELASSHRSPISAREMARIRTREKNKKGSRNANRTIAGNAWA